MTPPSVGIVTVNYNSGQSLSRFVESIPAAARTVPVSVVIVDNASSDAAAAKATSAASGAIFLPLESNGGYGAGIDAGVARLDGHPTYILISNPDVVLGAGAIDELVTAAERHPEAGAVGPRILSPDGSVYPSARKLPSLREGVGHVLFFRFWPSNPWTRSYREENLVVERECGWLSGACLLVRADVFAELGGFDTSFFMYFEDVDLGQRITQLGRTNRYVPSAVVEHTGAHSTAGAAGAMAVAHHDSAYRYLARRYSAWYLWPLRSALKVGLSVRRRILATRQTQP